MMAERQQQQFEAELGIGYARGGHACDHPDRPISDGGEEGADVVVARYRPQIEKALSLELTAKQRADPRTGDPERMAPTRVE